MGKNRGRLSSGKGEGERTVAPQENKLQACICGCWGISGRKSAGDRWVGPAFQDGVKVSSE